MTLEKKGSSHVRVSILVYIDMALNYEFDAPYFALPGKQNAHPFEPIIITILLLFCSFYFVLFAIPFYDIFIAKARYIIIILRC